MAKLQHKEMWRDIYPYDGVYQVSNFGRVKNATTNRVLTNYVNRQGYHKVLLSSRDADNKIKLKHWMVHRLVALCFVPIYSFERVQINHIDGVKWNNIPENLEWCTNLENQQHRSRMNKTKYLFGDRNNKAVITSQMSKEIKAKYATGNYTQKSLAEEYCITQSAVSQIVTNKIRKYD